MKYKEIIIRKLENLEGKINNLKHLSNTNGDKKDYLLTLNKMEEIIEEISAYIETQ